MGIKKYNGPIVHEARIFWGRHCENKAEAQLARFHTTRSMRRPSGPPSLHRRMK